MPIHRPGHFRKRLRHQHEWLSRISQRRGNVSSIPPLRLASCRHRIEYPHVFTPRKHKLFAQLAHYEKICSNSLLEKVLAKGRIDAHTLPHYLFFGISSDFSLAADRSPRAGHCCVTELLDFRVRGAIRAPSRPENGATIPRLDFLPGKTPTSAPSRSDHLVIEIDLASYVRASNR